MELERGMLRAAKLLAQPYELGLPASSEIKLSSGHTYQGWEGRHPKWALTPSDDPMASKENRSEIPGQNHQLDAVTKREPESCRSSRVPQKRAQFESHHWLSTRLQLLRSSPLWKFRSAHAAGADER